jgi:hypothetical protein
MRQRFLYARGRREKYYMHWPCAMSCNQFLSADRMQHFDVAVCGKWKYASPHYAFHEICNLSRSDKQLTGCSPDRSWPVQYNSKPMHLYLAWACVEPIIEKIHPTLKACLGNGHASVCNAEANPRKLPQMRKFEREEEICMAADRRKFPHDERQVLSHDVVSSKINGQGDLDCDKDAAYEFHNLVVREIWGSAATHDALQEPLPFVVQSS